MNWILFAPIDSTPALPDLPQRPLIWSIINDHVERHPEFVGAGSRTCGGILCTPSRIIVVQSLLIRPTSQRAGDVRANGVLLGKLEQSCRPWLKVWDEV